MTIANFRRRGGRRFPPKKTNPHNINREIKADHVRVVGEGVEDGSEILSIKEAILRAESMGLDLVEISPKVVPPVCKIIDYKKFLYKRKRKEKEMKSKATKVIVKEIRFGPNTDEHDFQFKLKHAEKFLKDGIKVKSYVFFRGRSIVYKEQGEILLLRFAQALEDLGKVEQLPKLEGKRMIMFIAPKVTKKK